VRSFAHGETIGGEPLFAMTEVSEAIVECTQHEIAVSGVELFKVRPEGFLTEGISTCEVQLKGQTWQEFVVSNNSRLLSSFMKIWPAMIASNYLPHRTNRSSLA
jgi:hypothetical protein